MAIRVVKPGKDPAKKLYEGKCMNCKCHVEFLRGDAKYVSDQRDGDYLSVTCPTCGHKINVYA